MAVNVEEAFLKSAHIIYDKWKRGLIQLEMPNTVQIRRNDKKTSDSQREAVRSLSLFNLLWMFFSKCIFMDRKERARVSIVYERDIMPKKLNRLIINLKFG